MKINPVEASLFVTLDKDLRQELIKSGVIPVNDIFYSNWGNRNKINLYYGSYGSGKSVDIVDEFIKKSHEDEYFRCYYGRKILEDVRGTVFKTITDRIKELHRERYYNFSDKPNGTMIISHKENGNEFIPFGANNPQSLKSIKDPTHFFCEELDQYSFEDFGFIYSRLRTEKAFTQLYAAFNTEKIYKSHWIRKVLFDGEFKDQAFRLKANYYDNFFINQDDYLSKLRLIANGNAATLNAIANGEWGMIRTGGEFWKNFDESKHVKKVELTQTTIHVSLDENVNPYVTQTIWQVLTGTKVIRQVSEMLNKSPDNNAPKAAKRFAEWLKKINYNDVVFVYGDPSGGKRSTIDENNASFFEKYVEVLRSYGFRVTSRVGRSAPEVALSAAFINAIYEANYGGWSIEISERCFASIEDYMIVKEDADGKMAKPKEKDKDSKVTFEPQGHISDSKRYFIIELLKDDWNKYKQRKSNLTSLSGFFPGR